MRNLTTAVTALSFCRLPSDDQTKSPATVLLAAVGNQLHIYHDSSDIPLVHEVLPRATRIHGFSPLNGLRLAVHGARIVTLLTLTISNARVEAVHVSQYCQFPDWVWTLSWIPTEPSATLAVATGHSHVWLCAGDNLTNATSIPSRERELTWSAAFLPLSKPTSPLRALAGTSFGDILIWTVVPSLVAASSTAPTAGPVVRVRGHAGPVMRLRTTSCAKRLVSASVDRSVRVWSACDACSICNGQGCFLPLLTHYGHLARVWDVAFVRDLPNAPVVSVAEDRSCRMWSSRRAGVELARFRGHAGRNVWSVAVYERVLSDGSLEIVVASGGEDGAIKMRTLPDLTDCSADGSSLLGAAKSGEEVECAAFELPGKLPNPRKSGGASDEGGRSIVLLSETQLVVSTDFGRVLVGELDVSAVKEHIPLDKRDMHWTEAYQDAKGTAYTPCSLTVCADLIFAGQTNGNVTILRARAHNFSGPSAQFDSYNISVFHERDDMVMGLFSHKGPVDQRYDLFASSGTGDVFHWTIVWDGDDLNAQFVATYRPNRVTKNSLVTSITVDPTGDVVLTGNKGGRVLIYLRPQGDANNGHEPTLPSSDVKVHDDRVSAIAFQDGVSTEEPSFTTAGFDGCVAHIKLQRPSIRETALQVTRRERTAERADTIVHLDRDGGRTLVAAFRGAALSVWDLASAVELLRHNVGNWRRAHAVRVTDGRATLIYWRAGRVWLARAREPTTRSMGARLHGGRTNAVAFVKPKGVVTAGEDTRVGFMMPKNGIWQAMQMLDGHISGVCAVHVQGRLLISAGGADEVVVWGASENEKQMMWRQLATARIGDLLGGRDVTADPLLRATAVGRGAKCLSCAECSSWTVGRSDGSVVAVHAGAMVAGHSSGMEWGMEARVLGRHTNGAIVCMGDDGEEDGLVVSGDSSGVVRVWDKDGDTVQWRMHDGGVGGVAIVKVGAAMVVVSGGDDERVCARRLWPQATMSTQEWRSEVGQGHSAAVTGVCRVDGVLSESKAVFVSVGADQRVLFWTIRLSEPDDAVTVEKNGVVMTEVADVGGVCAAAEKDENGLWRVAAVVCGDGMQVVQGPLSGAECAA